MKTITKYATIIFIIISASLAFCDFFSKIDLTTQVNLSEHHSDFSYNLLNIENENHFLRPDRRDFLAIQTRGNIGYDWRAPWLIFNGFIFDGGYYYQTFMGGEVIKEENKSLAEQKQWQFANFLQYFSPYLSAGVTRDFFRFLLNFHFPFIGNGDFTFFKFETTTEKVMVSGQEIEYVKWRSLMGVTPSLTLHFGDQKTYINFTYYLPMGVGDGIEGFALNFQALIGAGKYIFCEYQVINVANLIGYFNKNTSLLLGISTDIFDDIFAWHFKLGFSGFEIKQISVGSLNFTAGVGLSMKFDVWLPKDRMQEKKTIYSDYYNREWNRR